MHGNKNYGRARTDFPVGGFEPGVRLERGLRLEPGVREAIRAPRNSAAAARERVESALTDAAFVQLSIIEEKPGFDPYNSGSFDRKHSWARTHRR